MTETKAVDTLVIEIGDDPFDHNIEVAFNETETGAPVLSVGDDDTSFVLPLTREQAVAMRDWLNRHLKET